MITANIAGASGVRGLDNRRDRGSDSECSYSSADIEEIERNYTQNGGAQTMSEDERLALEEEAKRIRQLIIEHRRKKFCKDYKTWAYLFCVAAVVIGAIVLIVLAGMGLINATGR